MQIKQRKMEFSAQLSDEFIKFIIRVMIRILSSTKDKKKKRCKRSFYALKVKLSVFFVPHSLVLGCTDDS